NSSGNCLCLSSQKTTVVLSDLRAFNCDNSFDDHPATWPVVWLEDHDYPRSVSRFGSQLPEYRDRSAKLLATMMLSLRGTPFIYQGQEIGMTNFPFRSISSGMYLRIMNGAYRLKLEESRLRRCLKI
ncbi:alpha-amylase family glycosyl hydrolase, partial [Zymomonas mobilis]